MKRIIAYIALGVSAVTLLIALNTSQRRTAAAELALTENTNAAVAEASSELEQLTLSLEKLLLTTSPRQKALLLSQMILSADRTATSLSSLPDTEGQRTAVLAYLNQLSHLCQTHLANLAIGEAMDADTLGQFVEMLSGLRLLHAELALAQEASLIGTPLEQALPKSELTTPPSAQELTTYKALPSHDVGSGEAMQLAKTFVGEERVTSVAHAPDTTGALPAYGVTIQTADLQLNLEVTRRGGKILLMSPETADFPIQKSVDECSTSALAFLESRGFPQMEVTYHQIYDGLCVLTCVYVQNDVLIWPDRILVQVRMDTAEVVGIEARSFWKNHIPRKLQSPLLTEADARISLPQEATITDVRQCLLPMNSSERLCWQFTLLCDDDQYICYIDALTGEELLLEKIMQLTYGSIAA